MLYKLIIKAVGVVAVVVAVMFTGCDGNSGVDPNKPNNGGNPVVPNNPGNVDRSTPNVNGSGNYTGREVRIGSQTWMAENLNRNTTDSRCYRDSSSYCEKYGRLYTYDAAMSACPNGWHLPSEAEWSTLENYVGGRSTAGTKLKSATYWNGTDEYGFSALPGGQYIGVGCSGAGSDGAWWKEGINSLGWPSARIMGSNYEYVTGMADGTAIGYDASYYSVRCVRN